MFPWQRLAKDYDKARPRTYHGSTCKEVREEKRESNAGQVTTGAPMFLAFSSLWHSSSRTLLPLDRVSSEGQEKEVLSTHHEVQAFMTACKDDDEQWPVLQELIRKVDVERAYRRTEEAKWKKREHDLLQELTALQCERDELCQRIQTSVGADQVASMQISLNRKMLEVKRQARELEKQCVHMKGQLAASEEACAAAHRDNRRLSNFAEQLRNRSGNQQSDGFLVLAHKREDVVMLDAACECNDLEQNHVGRIFADMQAQLSSDLAPVHHLDLQHQGSLLAHLLPTSSYRQQEWCSVFSSLARVEHVLFLLLGAAKESRGRWKQLRILSRLDLMLPTEILVQGPKSAK